MTNHEVETLARALPQNERIALLSRVDPWELIRAYAHFDDEDDGNLDTIVEVCRMALAIHDDEALAEAKP